MFNYVFLNVSHLFRTCIFLLKFASNYNVECTSTYYFGCPFNLNMRHTFQNMCHIYFSKMHLCFIIQFFPFHKKIIPTSHSGKCTPLKYSIYVIFEIRCNLFIIIIDFNVSISFQWGWRNSLCGS